MLYTHEKFKFSGFNSAESTPNVKQFFMKSFFIAVIYIKLFFLSKELSLRPILDE